MCIRDRLIAKMEISKWSIELHFLSKFLIEQKTEKSIIENILDKKKNIWELNSNWAPKFWKMINENKLNIYPSPISVSYTHLDVYKRQEIGYAARSVPKDIYSGKPLNFGTHYGLNVRFGVSSKIAVGFEGQYQSFDIKSNIESTYQPMFQFDPTKVGTYNPTTIFNGIANVNYYNYNSKNTNLFEVGLGAGIQHLNPVSYTHLDVYKRQDYSYLKRA